MKSKNKTTPAADQKHEAQRVVDQEVDHGHSVETTKPVSEAEATAEAPTKVQPAGSADPTADATADGHHNGTENTHPQSPLHKGDLSDSDTKAVYDEFSAPGAQVLAIAEKYGITSERVFEIVDDINGVPEDER
jgi:hypothetical protein